MGTRQEPRPLPSRRRQKQTLVRMGVNQKQQSTCPSVSQKWAYAPRLGENKTKQNQKTPVAGAVALACLSHKRFDIKRGQTTVTCRSKGVGPWPCISGERPRQPKADKERGSGPGVFTYGQSAAGAVAPACFTHPHPYGREQKKTKKAQSLSHQIAGCSRGGSLRS